MGRLLRSFVGNDAAATAIEYGLLAALIAVIAIVGMTFAGGSLQMLFNHTANKATSVWDNVNMG
jgi:pilus assembly protein Flp/PilA